MARTAVSIAQYLKQRALEINAEIEKQVPKKEPREVYGLIREMLERGGKRFRPALCLLSCEAVDGATRDALPVAAAIELFHEFSLMHDDIEDDSEMRRGKPCLHRIYGVPLTINAGDALLVLVFNTLANSHLSDENIVGVQKILMPAFLSITEGQAIEMAWRQNDWWNVSERDYSEMASKKTAVLISAACEAGAYVGGSSKKQLVALRDYGSLLGLAFQIQDDVLNITGSEERYGKEIGGDVSEGKRTLLSIYALEHSAEKEELLAILRERTKDAKKVRRAISIMRDCRAPEYAGGVALKLAEKAKTKLNMLPHTQARTLLAETADFLVRRDV
jgi:geranylgeranyl diphosphate synthase type I